MVDGAAGKRQPSRAVEKRAPGCDHLGVAGALHRASSDAVAAGSATGNPGQHHVVTHLEVRHTGSHVGHDPGTFVAEDSRLRHRPLPADDVQVGMTHASRRDVHHYLARSRGGQANLPDLYGAAVVHDGSHGGGQRDVGVSGRHEFLLSSRLMFRGRQS